MRRRLEVRVSFAPIDNDTTIGRIDDVVDVEGNEDPTTVYKAFTK
jgi:hypothetical protein